LDGDGVPDLLRDLLYAIGRVMKLDVVWKPLCAGEFTDGDNAVLL